MPIQIPPYSVCMPDSLVIVTRRDEFNNCIQSYTTVYYLQCNKYLTWMKEDWFYAILQQEAVDTLQQYKQHPTHNTCKTSFVIFMSSVL